MLRLRSDIKNVSLTPELERFVKQKVDRGGYASAEDVVREGLRLLRDRDEMRETGIEELQRQVTVGLEEARRGQLLEGDAVFREVFENIDEES